MSGAASISYCGVWRRVRNRGWAVTILMNSTAHLTLDDSQNRRCSIMSAAEAGRWAIRIDQPDRPLTRAFALGDLDADRTPLRYEPTAVA